MEPIHHHSLARAGESAASLWALASTQFPKRHELLLQYACRDVFEQLTTFSVNARRALEYSGSKASIDLDARRWDWKPATTKPLVSKLWDALNFVVHAKTLQVGFEDLPEGIAVISGGAVAIVYVLASTDKRETAYVDPFAMAHAFFYKVLGSAGVSNREHPLQVSGDIVNTSPSGTKLR